MMLAIVGVGLIGGSFGLAARSAGLFDEIVGVDQKPEHLASAITIGLIDRSTAAVPPEAAAVLLAVPSNAVSGWLERLKDHDGLVFDAASVKAPVVNDPGPRPRRFVPAHPIAGSEQSGPTAARRSLFRDHLVVLTPADADSADVSTLKGWWEALGARVRCMAPEAHDELFALTSHLPHLAAFAYMQLIEAEHLAVAAGGFRDFSRIAASDPDMWVPVLRSNQSAVLAALDAYEAELERLRMAIRATDDEPLRALLADARERRRRYPTELS